MYREFSIGDMVICKSSGVVGKVIQFYVPTACAEQTMVITRLGMKYHAPTSDWVKLEEQGVFNFFDTLIFRSLDAIGSYGCIHENNKRKEG